MDVVTSETRHILSEQAQSISFGNCLVAILDLSAEEGRRERGRDMSTRDRREVEYTTYSPFYTQRNHCSFSLGRKEG